MAATKELIKRIRLTASAASITFYNIPQDFDGLELVVSARSDSATGTWTGGTLAINGSTANLSNRYLYGTGSSVASTSSSSVEFWTSNAANTANTFGNFKVLIPNYAGSTAKSFSIDLVTENNATAALAVIQAGLYNSSAAITSVTFSLSTGNMVQYSSAALYGWKKGSDGTTTVS